MNVINISTVKICPSHKHICVSSFLRSSHSFQHAGICIDSDWVIIFIEMTVNSSESVGLISRQLATINEVILGNLLAQKRRRDH